ncbi:MAG: hypothetical protein DRJ61_03145 [Acidobacteria bacterium]|nr:MAG: hypothetical protein DRJ65_16035 [Acidobacteriota bacterium]RLE35479.1 MAG: hypothetical protein DRJ61_03145 [Acidobacteriota bacterium]
MARQISLAFLSVTLVALLMFSGCYLRSEKTRGFHHFHDGIENGMSETQVAQLFRDTYSNADQKGWPSMGHNEGGYWFTLDPRSGAFNSEFIHVIFEGGSVVSKEYLPD